MAAAAALTLGTVFSSYATSKAIEDAKKGFFHGGGKEKGRVYFKGAGGKEVRYSGLCKGAGSKSVRPGRELTKLEGDISQKEEQIEEAKVELETAKITENRQYEDMKLRIQYMYEKWSDWPVGVHDAVREHCRAFKPAEYASQITSYDRKMLEEYRKTRQEVALKEEALKTEHQELLPFRIPRRQSRAR